MLDPGTKLGPYEVVSPLGAGGMGEVYRARDARLGRDVAIKVLPQHLSANPEVRSRFEREARTVSSLNHPNICTLFDVGREGDTDYLVMELVEGETLAERLGKGALPAAELLRFGTQMADALDRAHRAGVIHRDLKPANIMITRSGAKLMDFGLARATGLSGAAGASGALSAALSQSPTVAQALTTEGTLIGTFQYMSPEQLEGREADARSDIWALGCVLYEMATGRRAFEGRSQASLIAAILEREPATVGEAPSGASVGAGPPAGLDRLIRACLAKDPEERLQTAHDAKLQLQWIGETVGLSSAGAPAPAAAPARTPVTAVARLAWVVAGAAALFAIAGIAWLWPKAHAPDAAYRFRSEPLAGVTETFWPQVSPDGRSLLLEAADSAGTVRAWLRPMDQTLARPIVGSEGLTRAYWSPDSREIAFVAGGKILRLAITGGTPVVVCEAIGGADLSWGSRGDILMDGQVTDSLRVVPARGGELRPATSVDRAAGEVGSAWPCFLPDGRHFLFIGSTGRNATGGNIRLGKLGSLESKQLGSSDGRVVYAPGGWVLFLRGTTLLAQKLDLRAARLTGQPLTIAENVRTGNSAGHFSVSNTGVLAYARIEGAASSTLNELDRDGRSVREGIATGLLSSPALSPSGDRILYLKVAQLGDDSQVWVRDLRRGTEARLTFAAGPSSRPMWSPDGQRFATIVKPPGSPPYLWVGSADGLGARDSLTLPGEAPPMLTQWASAGSRLVLVSPDFQRTSVVGLDAGDRTIQPLTGLTAPHGQAVISPDGRWVAYTSTASGSAPQVFVQSLTDVPGRWQISTTVGFLPQWSKGGSELFYESPQGIMAVAIETQAGFHAGTPVKLLDPPREGGLEQVYWTSSSDGQRFFVLGSQRLGGRADIEIVTDFASLVNRK